MRPRAFVLVAPMLFALACSRPIEAELLEVRDASPARVQPGHRLALLGSGFPAGRDARVTFAGTLHRPGLPPRSIDVMLAGEALAADRVEVPMPASALRALGGRGTFRGSIRVAFGAGALDRGDVVGTLHRVELDLVPREAAASPVDPTFATRIGLELAPRDDDEIGVVIEHVAPGSRAEQAGLAPGDRILAAGGVNLLAPAELTASSGASELELRVAHHDEPAPFVVQVSLEGLDTHIDRGALRWAQLAALIAIAALVLLGPGAAGLDRLAPAGLRFPWAFAAAAFAGALALRAAISAVPALGLDAVLLALASGRGAAIVLGAPSRAPALIRALAGGLAIAVALGVATLAIGTTDPVVIEAAQGPWPWEWVALRSPVGPLSVALTALAAACGPALSGPADRRRALDDAFLVALATCAVIALAGGASAHRAIADVRPGLGWIGAASYGALTSLVAVLLRRARERGAAISGMSLLASSAVGSALAAAGALGWMELEVPREIERAIAEVLVAGAIMIVARLATARPAEPARAQHALL